MTTKNIIKILPFEDKFREELLGKLDTLDIDVKNRIIDILWDAYDAFYDLKLQENIELGMEAAKKGEEKLDPEFSKKMIEKTEKEMEKEAIEGPQATDLSAARAAMEMIIREIRASKNRN